MSQKATGALVSTAIVWLCCLFPCLLCCSQTQKTATRWAVESLSSSLERPRGGTPPLAPPLALVQLTKCVPKEMHICANLSIRGGEFPLPHEDISIQNSTHYVLYMLWLTVCSLFFVFLLSLNTDALAPPIKQKARFKIKDAKCHLRPRNKEKHREATRPSQQGDTKPPAWFSNFRLPFWNVYVTFHEFFSTFQPCKI